jgi:branched-chain amino acid transport system substrate-binding protein
VAQTLLHVLRQCGNDLSRVNVMRQAASIKDLALPMSLPGIKVNTSPTDFYPIEQEQLARFDGERWVLFGEIYDAGKKHGL